VKKRTVAGAEGWKILTRGMVTRTRGALAFHVNSPRPSIVTSPGVSEIVGECTTNDPK
jgi:hypothetical protein